MSAWWEVVYSEAEESLGEGRHGRTVSEGQAVFLKAVGVWRCAQEGMLDENRGVLGLRWWWVRRGRAIRW